MVKTFLKIDRSSLPKDGQAIRFQMPNEEWFTGYFVEGDDLFWVSESKWFNVFDVMCWENNDPPHIVKSRNKADSSTTVSVGKKLKETDDEETTDAAFCQCNVSGSLPLIIKAIDDTFNQVHYSHLHPDVVKPISHDTWREKWIKDNCGNDR